MNIAFHSFSNPMINLFKERIVSSLTDQQKKIILIALVAFSCLVACYVISHVCLGAKSKPAPQKNEEGIAERQEKKIDEVRKDKEKEISTTPTPLKELSFIEQIIGRLSPEAKKTDEYKSLENILAIRTKDRTQWKKRTEERQQLGVALQASFGKNISENLSHHLRELTTYKDVKAYHMTLTYDCCSDSPFEKLHFLFAYNFKLDKIVVALTGNLRSKSQKKDIPSHILNYKVTNSSTLTVGEMKHQFSKNEPQVICINSMRNLQYMQEGNTEFLCENHDSAWLLNYETEYIVEFPEQYKIDPIQLQLKFC